ncbi:VRR-NUC domain-containing protein [Clostridium botulinum]|uniref:VRR-NUC domain-containing protein n=1 Tax=Clostridium botulinum TaxID=1491 RepID=UPI000A172335|nr:VRR-NUC domain-containing protein [Clostridium botulinum]MBO0569965.1 VRR-NUC domain-containing protein [Clostridium botulinum]OSB13728.1 nuclease [Clostridium botulinum]
MLESSIEKRLKKEIEKLGGKALKFVSPGVSGVPDRIVLLPQGRIVFVELKAQGKNPRPIQKYRIKELRALGFRVEIIQGIEGINNFIKEIRQ